MPHNRETSYLPRLLLPGLRTRRQQCPGEAFVMLRLSTALAFDEGDATACWTNARTTLDVRALTPCPRVYDRRLRLGDDSCRRGLLAALTRKIRRHGHTIELTAEDSLDARATPLRTTSMSYARVPDAPARDPLVRASRYTPASSSRDPSTRFPDLLVMPRSARPREGSPPGIVTTRAGVGDARSGVPTDSWRE